MKNIEVALTKKQCFVCLKTFDGDIIMNTRLTKPQAQKVKDMHGKVIEIMKDPCEECKAYMNQGIIIISVREKSDPKNPYRTGGFFVVKDKFIKDFLKKTDNETMLKDILEKRVMFMNHEIVEKLGFFEMTKTENK